MKALRAWRYGVVVGHYNVGLEYSFMDLPPGCFATCCLSFRSKGRPFQM